MTEVTARLDFDANTVTDVHQYYHTRSLQFAWHGISWSKELIPFDGGFATMFTDDADGTKYGSFYIIESERGKGKWKNGVAAIGNAPIITMPDCDIEEFLVKNNVPYRIVYGVHESLEYQMIKAHYGNNKANRSKVWLMNHIDEGLLVMNHYGASEIAQRAYCLHPMTQNDTDLKANWSYLINRANPAAVGLSLEYRNIANAYLSHKVVEVVQLSPLEDVNMMLRGDKVQNYKDFILYHRGTHARSDQLDAYFRHWLDELGVTNFDEMFDKLGRL